MGKDVQLQLLIPELTLGTSPLDWAPKTKQPRKPREANFKRMCDSCGADIPSTGWRPGDLCADCIPENSWPFPAHAICGELGIKGHGCSCAAGECKVIPF